MKRLTAILIILTLAFCALSFASADGAAWTCPGCGREGNTGNFCPDCGTKKPDAPQGWTCPDCGMKNITFNFCPNCGKKRDQ